MMKVAHPWVQLSSFKREQLMTNRSSDPRYEGIARSTLHGNMSNKINQQPEPVGKRCSSGHHEISILSPASTQICAQLLPALLATTSETTTPTNVSIPALGISTGPDRSPCQMDFFNPRQRWQCDDNVITLIALFPKPVQGQVRGLARTNG